MAGLVWAVRRRIAVVTVSGESMWPALTDGDRVLVRRTGLSQLQPGQVVVIEKPGGDGAWVTPPPGWPPGSREWMIKRVAALPGDPWTGPAAPSPVWPPGPREPLGPPRPFEAATAAATLVPAGKFVVLGDNRNGSYDSRVFGYCPADRLLGVVVRQLPAR